ncbi:MAG: hypothetical protein J3R72DRAFT_438172 [Linnemannia gamsii]|nr:MAG: hypothetical protein J3R72DRAFT_438172 [Linnemannia gamsii]
MMFKSSITTFLLLATLAILASAQDGAIPPTPTTPTLAATSTTGGAATGGPTNTATPTTVPGVKPVPTNPMTAVPDFSSLAGAIASLATGRSQNPGFSPTPTPGGGANSASRLGGAGDVMTGLVMVVLSAVVAGAGTLAL